MPNADAKIARSNKARTEAMEKLAARLIEEKATSSEVLTAQRMFYDRTSGRRPGYAKAVDTVVADILAARIPAVTAAVKAEKAREEKTAAKSEAKAAKAAAKPAKAPARKVETVKSTPGAFLKQRRLARRTQTVVAIYDLTVEGADVKVLPQPVAEGSKYAVVCEDHGTATGVASYEKAWRAGLDATTVCAGCFEAAQGATA